MIENHSFFQCLKCNHVEVTITEASWICAGCGFAYPVVEGIPILTRDWQDMQKQIDDARQKNPLWYQKEQTLEKSSPYRHFHKKRRLYTEQVLSEYLKTKKKDKAQNLLDLGCGDGNHLSYLSHYATEIYGSDYNLLRLARARVSFPQACLYLANVLDYPSRENFFEIVVFNHVLEHIREDEAALVQIYRMIQPGGFFLLGIPNEGAAWWQLAYRLQPHMLRDTDHVQFYTAGGIRAKMDKAGFQVQKITPMGWGLPHWTLDEKVRQFRWVDDALEVIVKNLAPSQSSSLFILATK